MNRNREVALVAGDPVVAQLAGPVVPPCPDRAVFVERHGVIITTGDGDDVPHAENLNREVALVAGDPVVAQLAVAVVPPRPDRAVALQRHRVETTTGDGRAGKEGSHGLVAGGGGQRAGAVLSGTGSGTPLQKVRKRSGIRGCGQRDRGVVQVTAAAICAAVDVGITAADHAETAAGLGDCEIGFPNSG